MQSHAIIEAREILMPKLADKKNKGFPPLNPPPHHIVETNRDSENKILLMHDPKAMQTAK